MTGTIFLVAVLIALLHVMAPGWALREVAAALGLKFRRTGASRFLTPFALGVHLNAIWFLGVWVAFPGLMKPYLIRGTLALDLLIVLVGVVLSRRHRQQPDAGHLPLHLAVVAGLALLAGAFACLQAPSVLDSFQILQTQHFVLGEGWGVADTATRGFFARLIGLLTGSIACPPMPGFSGIMLLPNLLLRDFPVSTTSAGMKVLLFLMSGFAVAHVGERLGLRPRLAVTVALFAGLILSRFGMYGMVNLGKDSIFAVPMLVAGIVSLVGDKSGRQRQESNLYFSAAIFLGSVVVPYGLVFWAVYATLSLGRSRLLNDLISLLSWTVLALPVSIAGIHTSLQPGAGHAAPLIALISMQSIVALGLVFWRKRRPPGHDGRAWLAVLSPLVPLVAFALCLVLMPSIAHIISRVDEFGHPVTEVRAPLDGQTGFFAYLFDTFHENLVPLMIIAVVGCVALPFTRARYRRPGFVALFSFLPVTLVLVLLHLKLGLHGLTDFNIWDITKNVPQWFVGTLFTVFAVLALSELAKPFEVRLRRRGGASWKWVSVAPVVLVGGAMAAGAQSADFATAFHDNLQLQPTVTKSGGYSDPDIAQAIDFVWNRARGRTVFVSPDSTFINGFYMYQMYGSARTFDLGESALTEDFPRTYPQVAFLLSAEEMRRVVNFAQLHKASISISVTENHQYMLLVKFDGAALVTGPLSQESFVTIGSTAYGTEHVDGQAFKWAGKEVDLTILAPLEQRAACVDLQLIDPSGEVRSVEIKGGKSTQTLALSPKHTFNAALPVTACTSLVDGRGAVHLSVSGGDQPFPGDLRKVAIGIIWPPAVRVRTFEVANSPATQ